MQKGTHFLKFWVRLPISVEKTIEKPAQVFQLMKDLDEYMSIQYGIKSPSQA